MNPTLHIVATVFVYLSEPNCPTHPLQHLLSFHYLHSIQGLSEF